MTSICRSNLIIIKRSNQSITPFLCGCSAKKGGEGSGKTNATTSLRGLKPVILNKTKDRSSLTHFRQLVRLLRSGLFMSKPKPHVSQ